MDDPLLDYLQHYLRISVLQPFSLKKIIKRKLGHLALLRDDAWWHVNAKFEALFEPAAQGQYINYVDKQEGGG